MLNAGSALELWSSNNTFTNLSAVGTDIRLVGGVSANLPALGLKGTFTASGSITPVSGSFNSVAIGPTSAPGSLAVNVPSGTLTFSASLVNARNDANTASLASGLTKLGPGTLTLNAVNSFTGPVNVNGGTLQLSVQGTLSPANTVTLSGTGSRVLINVPQPFGSTTITASPSFFIGPGTVVETTEMNATVTLVSPSLSGGTLRTRSSLASTIGGLHLLGTVNVTGTQPSVIEAVRPNFPELNIGPATGGTLTLNVADATASPATDLTVDARLIDSRNTSNNGNIASSLLKTGPGRLTLLGPLAYTGTTTVTGGTLELAGSASVGIAPTTVTGSGSTLLLSRSDLWGNHNTFSNSNVSVRSGATLDSGGGFFNTFVNLDLQGGNVIVRDGSSANFPALGLVGAVSISGSQPSTFTTTGSTHAAINIGPSFSAGSLAINVADIPGAAVDAVFDVNFKNQRNNANTADLPSLLSKTGPGLLSLGGSSTYTGGTAITAGILRLTTPTALPPTGGLFFDGGTLQYSADNTVDYSARLSGLNHFASVSLDTNGVDVTWATNPNITTGLVKSGAGTLTLASGASVSPSVTVSGGTLQVGNGAAPVTLNTPITNNANLTFNTGPSGSVTHSTTISGTGSLTKTGTGTLQLTATNTYTGPTTLNAGFLFLAAGSATSSVTVNPSATLSLFAPNIFGPITSSPNTDLVINAGQVNFNGNFVTGRNLTLNGALLQHTFGTPGEAASWAVRNAISVTGTSASTISAPFGTNLGIRVGSSSGAALTLDVPDVTASAATDLFLSAPFTSPRLANGFTGNAQVVKTGAGTVQVGSQQQLSILRLDAGTVAATSSTLVTSGIVTFNGGVLRAASGDISPFIASSSQPIRYDTDGGTVTWSATVGNSNFGGLTKLGAGRLTFAAGNNYFGPTTVSAGTLALSAVGTIPAGSAVSVNANAELLLLRSDAFGAYAATTTSPGITVNPAGTLATSNSFTTFVSSLTLAGGNVSATGGLDATRGALAFKSTLNHTSLTFPSTITATGTNAFALIGPTTGPGSLTISVAEAPAPVDLLLAIPLRDARNPSNLTQTYTSGLTKTGTGTLALAAANTFTGPLLVSSGTVTVTPTGSISDVSAVTVSAAGTLALGVSASPTASIVALTAPLSLNGNASDPATLRLDTPTATVGGRTANPLLAVLPSLSIANDGAPLGSRAYFGLLDLGTNDALFPAADLATLTDLARAFVSSAGTQGLGTTAAIPFTAVALVPNTDPFGLTRFATFNGQAVSSTDVLAKFTYLGDTDLNGLLDARDFNTVLSNFSSQTVGGGWASGDLNYDGVTNATDWQLFLPAFSSYIITPAPLGDTNPATYPPAGTIPEPAALALLSLPALALTRRRRPPT